MYLAREKQPMRFRDTTRVLLDSVGYDRNSSRRGQPRRRRRPLAVVCETLEPRLALSATPSFFPTTYLPNGEFAAVLTGIGIMTDSVQVTTAPAGTYSPQVGSVWEAIGNELASLAGKSGVTIADLSNLAADLSLIDPGWSAINYQGIWPVVDELATAVTAGTSPSQAEADWNTLFAPSGPPQSVINRFFADFVQTIQDSHITSADLATLASNETAFIHDTDTQPGDPTTNQQQFTGEGANYQGYGYMVSTPQIAGFIGPNLSNFGVLTDFSPVGLEQLGAAGSDQNTLAVEFDALAEKSGLTVADLNRLSSDDQAVSQLQFNDVGVNWDAAQTAIGQLVIAVAAGTSTSQAQTDFRDSFAANAPAALLTQTINDVIEAVGDSHVTPADLSTVASDEAAVYAEMGGAPLGAILLPPPAVPTSPVPVDQPASPSVPVDQPASTSLAAVSPGTPFGFKLSVQLTSSVGKAALGNTITLDLADSSAGDTLTISTKTGTTTYSGLKLTKGAGFYRLLSAGHTPVKAAVRGVGLHNERPMLFEKTLTAGTGTHKHVIGAELTLSSSLDRSLAKPLAAKPARQAVDLLLDSVSTNGTTIALSHVTAHRAAGGMIVVIAKS